MEQASVLSALRDLLKGRGLDGMLIPRADAHQSEDCALHDNKLEFISGFTGSAGLALIFVDRALLFVDGRYQVQARHQVNPEWVRKILSPRVSSEARPWLIEATAPVRTQKTA